MPRDVSAARFRTKTATPVVDGLHGVLASAFQLYRDTHLAHFNVSGTSFPQLHALFEAQYIDLWKSLDALAERVRALDTPVQPAAFAAAGDDIPADAQGLLRHLADGNRRCSQEFIALAATADEAGDIGTADLATQRAQAHEKHAWMLRATMDD